MKILHLNKLHYVEVYQLWNNEYANIYPISKELFERNVKNIDEKASFVAIVNDQIIGFILAKTYPSDFYIKGYDQNGYISLMYVAPSSRNQGIGDALLNLALKEFARQGKTDIILGKDYNNFFPGLPVDLKSSASWFIKRGFSRPYDTYDLIRIKKDFLSLKNQTFVFRVANYDDKDNIIKFVNDNWPGRWTKETIDYFENGGTGMEYVICLDKDTIIGFAKIGYPNTSTKLISNSLTWRGHFKALGGIGPLGINANYRHQYLGYDIVAFATNTLLQANATEIIIDWTGLVDFYRKLDYEVYKSYFYMNMKTKGEKNA